MIWLRVALAFFVIGLIAVWQVQLANMEASHFRDMAAEKQKTTDVTNEYAAYKLAIEQTISNNARQHASAIQKALDDRDALAGENDRLRQQYAIAAKDRDEEAKKRIAALNSAGTPEIAMLGPAALAYLDSIRRAQHEDVQ